MATLSEAFLVNTRNSAPLNANAPANNAETQVSNFVTVQSLSTFAVAAPVLKTLWELLKAVGGGWAKSYWTVLGICFVYGAWQLLISVSGPNRVRGLAAIVSALIVGVANSAILAASIIGLTETTGVGES
jgi:uncharacterized membrane protein